jgi:DNA modification methylase
MVDGVDSLQTFNHLSDTLQRDMLGIKLSKEWAFDNIGTGQTTYLTHSYHRYPAKFIPQIVQRLMTTYARDKNQIICDPFGGCGTTLVEAKLAGHESIGFDINPLAKLITQTKITPIDPKSLERQRTKFLRYHEGAHQDQHKHNPRIEYWFDDATIAKLDRLYSAVISIKDPKIRRFFLCAFSNSLKNCSRWLMKSIKPTVDKDKIVPEPKEVFLRHLDSMIKKNTEFYNELAKTGNLNTATRMYTRDSTKKLPVAPNSVDLVISSPPYVTSYEYAGLHQLSLLWFGDDKTHFKEWNRFSNDFLSFRKRFIGTMAKEARSGDYGSQIAKHTVEALRKKDKPAARDVSNYFLDMKKAFGEMHRMLKGGGKAAIIIGNTSLFGVRIPNAQVAIEQMHNAGFSKVEYIKRKISNKVITPWRDLNTGKFTNGQNPLKKRVYAHEYILVMKKN